MKVGIVGATGYGGQELIRLLANHSGVDRIILSSRTVEGKMLEEVCPQFRHMHIQFSKDTIEELSEEVDVIFLATPNGYGMQAVTDKVLSNAKVIDLSADFRLKKSGSYKEWYNMTHVNEKLLSEAVYGLSEWNRDMIKKARLIANPGCYVTSSLLAILPLVKENLINRSIIIDAKSGVSGAGKSLSQGTHFTECNESFKAYKVGSHRHTPEIEEVMDHFSKAGDEYVVQFTPHLIPMNRGIQTTIYTELREGNGVSEESLRQLYKNYYQKEHFVRILSSNTFPETRWVKGSNYCDIGIKKDERTGRLILLSVIDNLVKGAAGQGIQNMNIMFGFNEDEGLKLQPCSI